MIPWFARAGHAVCAVRARLRHARVRLESAEGVRLHQLEDLGLGIVEGGCARRNVARVADGLEQLRAWGVCRKSEWNVERAGGGRAQWGWSCTVGVVVHSVASTFCASVLLKITV
jgi:hypothetical protein